MSVMMRRRGMNGLSAWVSAMGVAACLSASAARAAEPAKMVNEAEMQSYPHRMLWMWEEMDGKLLHDQSQPSFFSREDLHEPASVPRYVRFAELMQSMKINGLVVSVSFNDHSFMTIRPQLKALSEFLDDYGVGLYLHVPYGFYHKSKDLQEHPDCPYDPGFAAYYNDLAEKLFGDVPLLRGYVMKGTGYEGIPGPLSSRSPAAKGKTDAERFLKGLEVLADSVKPYGGEIHYRTWTTGAMQDREYALFKSLAGKTPDNVTLVTKMGYGDFGIQEIPHPLLGHLHPGTPHLAEFQVFGEYRGLHYNPCEMVTWWGEWMEANRDKIDGLMGIVEPGREEFDHPLNMVNYEAFGRYASEPGVSPEVILTDWAAKHYGPAVGPIVLDIVRRTSEATMKLMYFRGTWVQCHSILPSRSYLDSHLRGPWAGMGRDETRIGWGRPLDMFDEATAHRYANDPAFQCFVHRVPITDKLLSDMMAEQRDAVSIYKEMLEIWRTHEDKIPAALYEDLHQRLHDSYIDAQIWATNTNVYIRWLQGKDYAPLLKKMERLPKEGGTRLARTRARPLAADYRRIARERADKEGVPVDAWPVVDDGKARAVIVVPNEPSEALSIAAEDLQSLIQQISGAELDVVPLKDAAWKAPITHLVMVPNWPGAKVQADVSPETLVLRTMTHQGCPTVAITGGGDSGTAFAAYRFAEAMGARFFHPEKSYVLVSRTLAVGPLDIVEKPAYRVRGIQQHTLHPIPFTTIFMDKPIEENYERSCRYIDWLVRNRQNYLYWWWVERADVPELRDYVRRIVAYAHRRNVKVGVVVGMPFNNPQDSYNILRCEACHEEREVWAKCLRQGADEIVSLGVDSICVFFGEGEGASFRQPEGCPLTDGPVKPVVERIEVLQAHLADQHPTVQLLLWIHPTAATRGDEQCPNFFLLPKLCPPEAAAAVHTVKFYNLLDPAPTPYGADFKHLREYVFEEQGKRAMWYWPETAYACGFDIGVPMYWPQYLTSRWVDADFLQGLVEGHMTFSSGLEWMYWLNDYAVARFGWSPRVYTPQAVIEEYTSIFSEPVARAVEDTLVDLMDANAHYLIRLTHQQGLNVMPLLSVGPVHRLLDGLGGRSNEDLNAWWSLHAPALTGLMERYGQAVERLAAVEPLVDGDVRFWFDELAESVEITQLRCMHSLSAFDRAIKLVLAGRERREVAEADWPELTDIRKRAREIIIGREKLFRYPNGGHRGPYIGYMRPFFEWEHFSARVEQYKSPRNRYNGIVEFALGNPMNAYVRKPIGATVPVEVVIPEDFPQDGPLALLVEVYDTDSPKEGTVIVAGTEYPLIQSGNGRIAKCRVDLPPDVLPPGRHTIRFKFNDDVNGATGGYDVAAIVVAVMEE